MLVSPSKPAPSRVMSFATTRSRCLVSNLSRAFSTTFSLSAANPTSKRLPFSRATSSSRSAVGSNSNFNSPRRRLILCFSVRAGRKSATAAALITTVVCGNAARTAWRISSVVRTRSTRTPLGTGMAVGPLTKITSAPRRRAASATAYPIRPEDRLVM